MPFEASFSASGQPFGLNDRATPGIATAVPRHLQRTEALQAVGLGRGLVPKRVCMRARKRHEPWGCMAGRLLTNGNLPFCEASITTR
jgi:hypothetical protein